MARGLQAGSRLLLAIVASPVGGWNCPVSLKEEACAVQTGIGAYRDRGRMGQIERLLERGDLQPAGEGWAAVSLNGAAR
jgi:hypothetical protein